MSDATVVEGCGGEADSVKLHSQVPRGSNKKLLGTSASLRTEQVPY